MQEKRKIGQLNKLGLHQKLIYKIHFFHFHFLFLWITLWRFYRWNITLFTYTFTRFCEGILVEKMGSPNSRDIYQGPCNTDLKKKRKRYWHRGGTDKIDTAKVHWTAQLVYVPTPRTKDQIHFGRDFQISEAFFDITFSFYMCNLSENFFEMLLLL